MTTEERNQILAEALPVIRQEVKMRARELRKARLEPEDVTNDCVILLIADLERNGPPANPGAYVRIAARRDVANMVRREIPLAKRTIRFSELKIDPNRIEEWEAATPPPPSLAELMACERSRKVMQLRSEGYLYREIAEALGMSLWAVWRVGKKIKNQIVYRRAGRKKSGE